MVKYKKYQIEKIRLNSINIGITREQTSRDFLQFTGIPFREQPSAAAQKLQIKKIKSRNWRQTHSCSAEKNLIKSADLGF
jgi:hypothetical protein